MLIKTRWFRLEATNGSLYLRIGSRQGVEVYTDPRSGLSTCGLFVMERPNGEPC